MEFKSRTDLANFFREMEDEGWITSEWKLDPAMISGVKGTRATRVYSINFMRVK